MIVCILFLGASLNLKQYENLGVPLALLGSVLLTLRIQLRALWARFARGLRTSLCSGSKLGLSASVPPATMALRAVVRRHCALAHYFGRP
jgi:hypothetical protein